MLTLDRLQSFCIVILILIFILRYTLKPLESTTWRWKLREECENGKKRTVNTKIQCLEYYATGYTDQG